VKIDAGAPNRPLDFEIQVPLKTSLKLSLVNNATLTVSDVEGELELENVNGPITLTNIAGSVVAHTVNGRVAATMTRIAPDKPMAFTSLNGNVDVTLPASIKATFKLRSDRGDVFTDFDMQTRANPRVAGDSSRGRQAPHRGQQRRHGHRQRRRPGIRDADLQRKHLRPKRTLTRAGPLERSESQPSAGCHRLFTKPS
jgi:hypothetical protein